MSRRCACITEEMRVCDCVNIGNRLFFMLLCQCCVRACVLRFVLFCAFDNL